jgi:hypothetical protein
LLSLIVPQYAPELTDRSDFMRCESFSMTSRDGLVRGEAETCADDASATGVRKLRSRTMTIATFAESE